MHQGYERFPKEMTTDLAFALVSGRGNVCGQKELTLKLDQEFIQEGWMGFKPKEGWANANGAWQVEGSWAHGLIGFIGFIGFMGMGLPIG